MEDPKTEISNKDELPGLEVQQLINEILKNQKEQTETFTQILKAIEHNQMKTHLFIKNSIGNADG